MEEDVGSTRVYVHIVLVGKELKPQGRERERGRETGAK